jgi:uncharacterized protein YecT (DUF1311 family)
MRLTLLLTAVLSVSASCASRRQTDACLNDARGVDTVVCRSSDLRRLDRRLADRYSSLFAQLTEAEAEALRDDQRQWLQERDDWCSSRATAPGGVHRCLADASRDRLDDLDRLAACGEPRSTRRPAVCALRGEWTVSKVRTGPGVQAVRADDPLYLNKIFRAEPGRLQFAAERCDVSRIERMLRSTRRWFKEHHDVEPRAFGWDDRPLGRSLVLRPRCRSGTLGPPAAGGAQIIVGPGDEIGFNYYDGAFLLLRRSR